jgi:hypothetical protein
MPFKEEVRGSNPLRATDGSSRFSRKLDGFDVKRRRNHHARGPGRTTMESLLSSWARSLRAAGKSTNTVSGYLDGVRWFTNS